MDFAWKKKKEFNNALQQYELSVHFIRERTEIYITADQRLRLFLENIYRKSVILNVNMCNSLVVTCGDLSPLSMLIVHRVPPPFYPLCCCRTTENLW